MGTESTVGVAGGPPKTELDDFVLDLVRAYPRAVVTTDASGRVPFVSALYNFVDSATCQDGAQSDQDERRCSDAITRDPESLGIAPLGIAPQPNFKARNQVENIPDMEQIRAASVISSNVAHQREDDESTLGSRSVFTNWSVPTLFKNAAYAPSSEVSKGATRAMYRNRDEEDEDNTASGKTDSDNEFDAEFADLDRTPKKKNNQKKYNKMDSNGSKMHKGEASLAFADANGGMLRHSDSSFPMEDEVISTMEESSSPNCRDVFPTNVALSQYTEWTLRMLSNIVDLLENAPKGVVLGGSGLEEDDEHGAVWQAKHWAGKDCVDTMEAQNNGNDAQDQGTEWLANTLIAAVASIPSLLKTLLLMDDSTPSKIRIFNLTIVKRILKSKYAVGNWIVYALEATDPNVANKGVQYFEMVSSTSEERVENMKSLYGRLSRLPYLLPSILSLEDKTLINRISKTAAVRHVLDKELASSSILPMAFVDLLFHLLLLISYQCGTNYFLRGNEYSSAYTVTLYCSLLAILYGFSRKITALVSFAKIGRSAFFSNNFRFGDVVVDWGALGMVLGGVIWMEVEITNGRNAVGSVQDGMRGYLAASTGLLWWRVLRWFYVVNWDMTSFVHMLRQMTYDVRWLLLNLTFIILSFSQMFHIMLNASNDCNSLNDGFCDSGVGQAYLQVYSMALGQFDPSSFTTTFSVLMFSVFTFIVLIIMLTALVALIIDSHTKIQTVESQKTLPSCGSCARLSYVMDLRVYRHLLTSDWHLVQYCAFVMFVFSAIAAFLLASDSVRSSINEHSGSDTTVAVAFVFVLFLMISVLAFVGHVTYSDFAGRSSVDWARRKRGFLWNRIVGSRVVFWLSYPILMGMRWVLGVSSPKGGVSSAVPVGGNDELATWNGGVTHLHRDVKHMLRSTARQNASQMSDEVTNLEGRMLKSSDLTRKDVLSEIRASEERLEKMISELQSTLLSLTVSTVESLASVDTEGLPQM